MTRKRALASLLAVVALSTAARADAFCGFYVGGAGAKMFNDATTVVLMREGTKTILSMQNAYKGPPERFALVIPVPVVLQEENVKTLPREVFDKIDRISSPRLVEYWEQDPCAPDLDAPKGGGLGMRKMEMASNAAAAMADSYGVTIEAKFTVGEYQIVILGAQDSAGLDAWLKAEQYSIPEGSEPYFRPYVAAGSKFFVAKVDPAKVRLENGQAMLSPLRFHYDDTQFRLPVRLGLVNSSGTQDLIVQILARKRYELANYPNVTIPTNLDVSEAARDSFGTFYTTLFDKTLAKNPKAAVTEYAWAPTTCDPCPGPALDASDLATLGTDVFTGKTQQGGGYPGPATTGGMPFYVPPYMGSQVLTRLHLRYTKESLGEDLVFREAEPIVGGREQRAKDGSLEHGAQKSSYDNFQARYAIRHAWTGPIDCKQPRRGVWGGKPGAHDAPDTKAAARLNLVPHTNADLASFVRQDIPELDFKATSAKRGCLGCTITAEPRTAAGWVAGLALVILGVRRRRR